MSSSYSMNTKSVQSGMTTVPDSVSQGVRCTNPFPDDEYTFTMNSKADSDKKTLPAGSTLPSHRDDRYEIRSAFTGHTNGILHTAVAFMARPDLPGGLVPGDPAPVEAFYPINKNSFTWFPKTKSGQWDLKAGPFEFALEGSAYSPTKGWGMDVNEFAPSEWKHGRMSIVGVKVKEGHLDSRPRMTQDSLNTACAGSVASRPSTNITSVSEK